MNKRLAYELGRGFAYRKIVHADMSIYTRLIPGALSFLVVVLYFFMPVEPTLFGKDGVVSGILSVLATLPGFYFAGLAAVATFSSPTMDKEMPDPAPTIIIEVSGGVVTTKLTRRLFLTYLFSYLVVVSLILCFSLLFLNTFSDSLLHFSKILYSWSYGEMVVLIFKYVVISVIVFLLSSLSVTTLQGVFFLTEKMHQP